MTILFEITHAAAYGEEVLLNVISYEDGMRKTARLGMSTLDCEHWTFRLDGIDSKTGRYIDYYYSVDSAGCEREREWTGVVHRIDMNLTHCEFLRVCSVWYGKPSDARMYTSAFAECLCRRQPVQPSRTPFARTLRIVVRAPQLRSGERLAVVGSDRMMGGWDSSLAVDMVEHTACEWQADFNVASISGGIEFKFVAVAADGGLEWETGGKRTLAAMNLRPGEAVACELAEARFDRCDIMPECRHVSVAKLRTDGSFGVGDFGDLAAFVAAESRKGGARMVCMPPVCDTISTRTDADATPYSIVSVYALHPLLCDIRQIPSLSDSVAHDSMERQRQKLNALAVVNYSATLAAKLEYLHEAFLQDGDRTMHSAAFRRFFADNEHWLVPYAQYSYLRDAYDVADFRHWPSHTEWTEAERGQLQNPRTKAYKKLAFIYYVQYVLHCQLRAVHDVARQGGIVLAGDMTANVNPNGCDVWRHPDDIGSDAWWVQRLAVMENYYDACLVAETVLKRRHIVESTRMWLGVF